MPSRFRTALTLAALPFATALCLAQAAAPVLVELDRPGSRLDFPLATPGHAAAIYVAPGNPETVRVAAQAFASDIAAVTGTRPRLLTSLAAPLPEDLVLVGVLGHSPEIDALAAAHTIDTSAVAGQWEAALSVAVPSPPSLPGVHNALVLAGSDRRGAAYALFALSRQIGVSPWTWWADVPIPHHTSIGVLPIAHVQPSPSVQYRGIFLNDEDWGLRPWAAKKMDPTIDHGNGNIGPHTYERIFELLLRLHANSLWPAMHPGTLAFNAVPENAVLADRWGIVMGSSHSEALLRNNVGEWSEKPRPAGDGPWNYQTNMPAMVAYWDKRLVENGKYENFYTVGLRGLHDSGLEATGTPQDKAMLVEDAMTAQRDLLARRVNPDITSLPQVIWLYKESLDLYRAGMKVPPDVTLGWTDDNYGYLRELPNAEEQKRPGGSGVYYHVSYWGAPHDYLWLCTTPPALIREELTKAYDHNARKYWILNVGDLKPAEMDIDYFMQLAVDEPVIAQMSQHDFLAQWFSEQFPDAARGTDTNTNTNTEPGGPSFESHPKGGLSSEARPLSSTQPPIPGAPGRTASPSDLGIHLADVMTEYYHLNFIRKPEFMGFNGYNDGINRTAFNPLAWGGRPTAPGFEWSDAAERITRWSELSWNERAFAKSIATEYRDAFFELVSYPVETASAMNLKFLLTDQGFLQSAQGDSEGWISSSATRARANYDFIQTLTARYNSIENGKWDGIMSSAPRERHVFEMPRTATLADASTPLPASWGTGQATAPPAPPLAPGFVEQNATVSINAAHFARKHDATLATWNTLADLGISGPSVVYGAPGLLANEPSTPPSPATPWLEYDFTTTSSGPATLTLHLLPTFPVDSDHRLRYAVSIDGHPTLELDASAPPPRAGKAPGAGDGPANSGWAEAVLRNSATATMHIDTLAPGAHTIRLLYCDPGVVFEHLVLTFPGAPPAYPVPPETGQ